MKNKDQVLLEELYLRIFSESEFVKGWKEDPLGLDGDPLGLKYNPSVSNEEDSGVNVRKIVHDILNDIQPHVFDLDSETYKEAIKTLIDRLNSILQRY
jgi:hypothetical protein